MLTRLSKASVLMFLLGVSACKSPPPVQSQRPEPAAWAMEKAQDLQQMLNSIITVSEVESTGYPRNWSIYWSVWMGFCF